MAIGIKVCKVCGKEYESCHTLRPNLNNEFRWQDVACCPEHGAEYLRQIMESRGQIQPDKKEAVRDEAPDAAPKKRSRKKKTAETPVDQEEMA